MRTRRKTKGLTKRTTRQLDAGLENAVGGFIRERMDEERFSPLNDLINKLLHEAVRYGYQAASREYTQTVYRARQTIQELQHDNRYLKQLNREAALLLANKTLKPVGVVDASKVDG